ncbi:membrane progesterone receptor epsilon-like [Microcaecilia unicolor]|uniref:Membrane progesterone receptor epsilon-like n=1 Tax=Microcaecilia unicolor TaxID=1415580 RepID=A0A6P7WSQ5_9AMPH|nr:membrane progesterone receptor epsilon-like [Microcaecilia unicolor]XP_030043418.1 membrane progesterone receptor epsilon-like [Microcaecilia unicolor]
MKAMLFRGRSRASLLRYTEVPPAATECFILTGYRSMGCSFSDCLFSAFRATNETGNFWTHFLAVFIFGYHCVEFFSRRDATGASCLLCLDPFYYPFWSYFAGVCGLLVVSSMAHLFSSMSLVIREICFCVDYGAIGTYTVGSALVYFYYINPWLGVSPQLPLSAYIQLDWWFEVLYIPLCCLVALFCTLACCHTRQRWQKHCYLIRTLVFLLPFTVVSLPIFYRLLVTTSGDSTQNLATSFLHHCLWLAASAAFNITKIPERLSPGKFDIWGGSHQWFHFCAFMSILEELHMIQGEMEGLEDLLRPPTFLSTFGVLLLLQGCIAVVVCWFVLGYSSEGKKLERH